MTSSLLLLSNDANETLKRFGGSLKSVSAKRDWPHTKLECERPSSPTSKVARTGQPGTVVPEAVAALSLPTARVWSLPKRKRLKTPCEAGIKGRSKLGVVSEERQVSDNEWKADLSLWYLRVLTLGHRQASFRIIECVFGSVRNILEDTQTWSDDG
jgi:hypothetical protein